MPRPSGGWLGAVGGWAYRYGLERGYLDAALDRFLVRPFLVAIRTLDAWERRAAAALNGVAAPPTPPKEDRPA